MEGKSWKWWILPAGFVLLLGALAWVGRGAFLGPEVPAASGNEGAAPVPKDLKTGLSGKREKRRGKEERRPDQGRRKGIPEVRRKRPAGEVNLVVKVLEEATGKPVPGALVRVLVEKRMRFFQGAAMGWENLGKPVSLEARTGADGTAKLKAWKWTLCSVQAVKGRDGETEWRGLYFRDRDQGVELRLNSFCRVRGWVLTFRGEGVPAARVEVSQGRRIRRGTMDPKYHMRETVAPEGDLPGGKFHFPGAGDDLEGFTSGRWRRSTGASRCS